MLINAMNTYTKNIKYRLIAHFFMLKALYVNAFVIIPLHIYKDVNDERPQFRSSFYAAEIPENSPKGTPVIFLGSAVNEVFDHDLG